MHHYLFLYFTLASLYGYNQTPVKVLFFEVGKTFTYKVTCEVEKTKNRDFENVITKKMRYPALKMTVKKILKYNDSLYVIKLSNFFSTSVEDVQSKKDVYIVADDKNKKLYTKFFFKEDIKEPLSKAELEKKVTDVDTGYLDEIRYTPQEHVFPFLNLSSTQTCDSLKQARDSIHKKGGVNNEISGHFFGCIDNEYQLKSPYLKIIKVFSNDMDFDRSRHITEIHVNEDLGIVRFYASASLIYSGSSVQYDLLDAKKRPYNDDVIE